MLPSPGRQRRCSRKAQTLQHHLSQLEDERARGDRLGKARLTLGSLHWAQRGRGRPCAFGSSFGSEALASPAGDGKRIPSPPFCPRCLLPAQSRRQRPTGGPGPGPTGGLRAHTETRRRGGSSVLLFRCITLSQWHWARRARPRQPPPTHTAPTPVPVAAQENSTSYGGSGQSGTKQLAGPGYGRLNELKP